MSRGETAPVAGSNRKCFDFSLRDYRVLVQAFLDLDYKAVDLEELMSGGRAMFLRHDVDLCLDRALAVARAEYALGVRATYYILVSTVAYNVASAACRGALGEMAQMGHGVGLHFDATKYDGGRKELEEAARTEADILAHLMGAEIDSISFHRPAPELIGLEGSFAGLRHTYEPQIVKGVAYVSDSSGGFFHGHPLDHPAVAAGQPIQLLTHPVWWSEEDVTSPQIALDRLRSERYSAIEEILGAATARAATRAKTSGT